MQLIMFTKMLKEKSIGELVELAHEWGLDGYDLCVRPEYPVTPDNARKELPKAVTRLRNAGLSVPLVTAPWDLLKPSEPYVENLMAAMDEADVRHLKIGYFKYDPFVDDYQMRLLESRLVLRSWEPLAKKYNICICYHTHSNRCMGLNGGAMAHLLEGLNPAFFGAYLDAGHMRAEGEEFAVSLGMLQPWIRLLSIKDVLLKQTRENGHGKIVNQWLPAGKGSVNWTNVFDTLRKFNWDKPISIHCEFQAEPDEFLRLAKREVAFFRKLSK